MKYYPLFFDLHGAKCLLVGGGKVGLRKIGTLLKCSPSSITVIDPFLSEEEKKQIVLLEKGACRIQVFKKHFSEEDVKGHTLVFSATPSPEVNTAVALACRTQGILCNIAGPTADGITGNFIVPAHIENGDITIALSTSGASPAFSRMLKEELENWLDKGYSRLILLLNFLRPQVIALKLGSNSDADIFRSLCAQPLRTQLVQAIQTKNKTALESLLRPVLPSSMKFSAEEFFHVMD